MTYPAESVRPKPRPRSHGLIGILAATAVAATAAGCGGQAAAPPAATASLAATHLAAQAPAPSCKQQYSVWKHGGPARAQAKQLTSALNAVQTAAGSEDVAAMTTALKTVGAAAVLLGQYPMPACADPRGYWNAVLTRIHAAGDNAASASGLSALILAEAPLQGVSGLEAKLTAELKRTT